MKYKISQRWRIEREIGFFFIVIYYKLYFNLYIFFIIQLLLFLTNYSCFVIFFFFLERANFLRYFQNHLDPINNKYNWKRNPYYTVWLLRFDNIDHTYMPMNMRK